MVPLNYLLTDLFLKKKRTLRCFLFLWTANPYQCFPNSFKQKTWLTWFLASCLFSLLVTPEGFFPPHMWKKSSHHSRGASFATTLCVEQKLGWSGSLLQQKQTKASECCFLCFIFICTKAVYWPSVLHACFLHGVCKISL